MSTKYNVLAIPVASQMVSKSKAIELKEDIKEKMIRNNENTKIEFLENIMNERNWEDITLEVNKSLDYYDGFLIIHLSGGTSRIVLEFLTDLMNIKPFALFAVPKYNSLPSALNTRERIIQFLSKEIYIPIIYDRYDLEGLFKDFYVVDKVLRKYDVLFIAPAIGVKVQPNFRLIRPSRLSKIMKKMSDKEIAVNLKEIKNYIKLDYRGSDNEKLSLSLYISLKSMLQNSMPKNTRREVPGLACLDCYYMMRKRDIAPCLAVSLLLNDGFLIACQRDLSSLFAMLLLRLLTGQPAWIADVSKLDKERNTIILSHSCFNLAMADGVAEAIMHPITNLPYAVRADMKPGKKITMLTIDPVTEEFDVETGEIVDLDSYEEGFEASQIGIKLLNTDVEEFLKKSHRGHYTITLGDWRQDLERINKFIIQVKTIRMLKGK